MRLLEHTLSSDASIHLGGLVVKMILASDRITHAVPLGAARANTKHLHLFSKCSEIEKGSHSSHQSLTMSLTISIELEIIISLRLCLYCRLF